MKNEAESLTPEQFQQLLDDVRWLLRVVGKRRCRQGCEVCERLTRIEQHQTGCP